MLACVLALSLPGSDTPRAHPSVLAPGGVVVPLYPEGSRHLKSGREGEAEVFGKWNPSDPRFGYVVNIHTPTLEFHPAEASRNTGALVILAGGGGHERLGVFGEGVDCVPFFSSLGVNVAILRYRLRSDGYDPRSDGFRDALQALRVARAHSEEWRVDPRKIGLVGFPAGAEHAAGAAVDWGHFANDTVEDPVLAATSPRPDFVVLVYPGPSPFSEPNPPKIPRNAPPAFIATAGYGDRVHALWADDFFRALLEEGVPNVELHVYGRGKHPGDPTAPNEPPSGGGLSERGGIPFGAWHVRFAEWFRDLGFLQKPGVETQAARDISLRETRPGPAASRL